MRIVGGNFRGKKLLLPADKRVRPTSDRSREALFNILAHDKEMRRPEGPLPVAARVLDIFAGTGALGLEALSRGADHVTFIDNHPESLRLIRENAAAFKAARQVDILNRDGAHPGQAAEPYDLVLLDPPYCEGLALPCLASLAVGGWLAPSAVVVIELAAKEPLDPPSGFSRLKERRYGAARLVFLKYTG